MLKGLKAAANMLLLVLGIAGGFTAQAQVTYKFTGWVYSSIGAYSSLGQCAPDIYTNPALCTPITGTYTITLSNEIPGESTPISTTALWRAVSQNGLEAGSYENSPAPYVFTSTANAGPFSYATGPAVSPGSTSGTYSLVSDHSVPGSSTLVGTYSGSERNYFNYPTSGAVGSGFFVGANNDSTGLPILTSNPPPLYGDGRFYTIDGEVDYIITSLTLTTAPLPVITSVSAIQAQPTQTITITGSGFGTLNPYNGDSYYIRISDTTGDWNAGYSGDPGTDYVTLSIASWTDTQIVISGFTGQYGNPNYNWTLKDGDSISVQIWNAQSGNGPAVCTTVVGTGSTASCGCASASSNAKRAAAVSANDTGQCQASTTIVVGSSPTILSSKPALLNLFPTYPGGNAAHPAKVNKHYPVYVGCQTGAGQLISNCTITLTLTEKPIYSGGHQHDNGKRPLGEIVMGDGNESLCTQDGASCVSQVNNLSAYGTLPTEMAASTNSSLTFTTSNASAPTKIFYLPPQVGGDVNLQITATDAAEVKLVKVTQTFHITTASATGCADAGGLITLCPIPDIGSSYLLTDIPPNPKFGSNHPTSHYGTPAFNKTLLAIADAWYYKLELARLFPVPLAINDMSVIDGGLLDYDDTGQDCDPDSSGNCTHTPKPWKKPHAAHRWGDMADLGSGTDASGILPSTCPSGRPITCWLPVDLRPAFVAYLQREGYPPIREQLCDPVSDPKNPHCTHWHIQPAVSQ